MAVAKTRVVSSGTSNGQAIGKHIASRMVKCSKVVSPEEQRKRMPKVGVALRPYAWKAATRDVGTKRAFSGWRRNAGIRLNVDYSVHTRNVGLTMHRENRSAGPWRVAEEGRNRRVNAFHGPGINRRKGGGTLPNAVASRARGTPTFVARKFKGRKRWNGTTKGKDTWSHAAELMAEQAPRLINKGETVAIGKAFLGK